MSTAVVVIVLAAFIICCIFFSVKTVPRGYAYVVERNRSYHTVWEEGIHFMVPFIDAVVNRVSTDIQIIQLRPVSLTSKDGAQIQIETVVNYIITDAKKYTYDITNVQQALENLTASTLKTIAVHSGSEDVVSLPDNWSSKLTDMMSKAVEIWGMEIQRVELIDISTLQ